MTNAFYNQLKTLKIHIIIKNKTNINQQAKINMKKSTQNRATNMMQNMHVLSTAVYYFVLIGILFVTQSVISVQPTNDNRNVRLANELPQLQQQQHHHHHHHQLQQHHYQQRESDQVDSDEITFDKFDSIDTEEDDYFSCCAKNFGECRRQCENLLQKQWDNTHKQLRWELKKYCPSKQTEFWGCMNKTIKAVVRGAHWSGRRCCHLGRAPKCRNACGMSTSFSDIEKICRPSDEQQMMSCFKLQAAGDECCSDARTSQCLQACHQIFEPNTVYNQSTKYQQLQQHCGERNADVIKCVQNITNIEPISNVHKYLPCCLNGRNERCSQSCRNILNTSDSMEIIIAELESADCGKVMPHVPFWQCFFTANRELNVPANSANPALTHLASGRKDISQLNEIGIDAAKLHCCEKASSSECRRLCTQLYSHSWWETRELFDVNCLQHPNELSLRQCIDEVEHPCELGCDGLSFCTNFNNRPTELFRSCRVSNDVAAHEDLKLLEHRGTIQLMGVTVHIKNTTRCAPAKWRAIVCTLQLKPCTRQGHYNNICRRDCYELLHECLDWTQQGASLNADAICARLQPTMDAAVSATAPPMPCVPLQPYLEESDAPKETGGHHALTSPCKGRPCNASEVCIASRNGSTKAYQCVPGCAVGETTNYLVPFGAFVRIPVLDNRPMSGGPTITTSATAIANFKVCRCGMHGRIEYCQPLPNFVYRDCVLPSGRSFKHGTSFYLECNLCSCFANEITCTKRQCRLPGYTDVTYTSLPCNCPTHYVPVCGSNGNTYHSACLAKCMGLQDSEFEYGACSAWNPCREGAYSCPVGTHCFPKRKVCLSSMQRPCQQYQCVNQTLPCRSSNQPVCDSKGQTHSSACSLLQTQTAQFAYWGSCQRDCMRQGPVCGINGITYTDECAAWAEYIVVDYRGRCREVGLLTHDMGRRCRTVNCPPPVSKYCRSIVPPGACCPICAGGALRVIYSRKQLDRAMYALRGQQTELLTLQSMLHELDALIQIAECQLTGMLTMEVGIFVGVVPRSATPTRMQIEACGREAEKLSTLIATQTHRITTNVVLSSLTVSHMIEATVESTAHRPRPSGWNALALFATTAACIYLNRRFFLG